MLPLLIFFLSEILTRTRILCYLLHSFNVLRISSKGMTDCCVNNCWQDTDKYRQVQLYHFILWMIINFKKLFASAKFLFSFRLNISLYYCFVSGNLYFTNSMRPDTYIEVSRLNGSQRLVLLKSTADTPTAIAVNPIKRWASTFPLRVVF